MPDQVSGWDGGVRPGIDALVRHVGETLPLLETTPSPRLVAAAYLARVRHLVVSMEALLDAGEPGAIGILLRVLFEAWAIGMWVILVGEEAVRRLDADYARRTNQHIERARLPVEPLPTIEEVPMPPSVRDIVIEVSKRLAAEGDEHAHELPWTYDLVYAGESNMNVHGGLASVLDHMSIDDEGRGIVLSERARNTVAEGGVLWAAWVLLMLARRVFLSFGLDVEEIDRLGGPLRQTVEELNEEIGDLRRGEA